MPAPCPCTQRERIPKQPLTRWNVHLNEFSGDNALCSSFEEKEGRNVFHATPYPLVMLTACRSIYNWTRSALSRGSGRKRSLLTSTWALRCRTAPRSREILHIR